MSSTDSLKSFSSTKMSLKVTLRAKPNKKLCSPSSAVLRRMVTLITYSI
jgi:hypothetical protein